MRPRLLPVVLLALFTASCFTAGCGGAELPVTAPPTTESLPPDSSVARIELAARAALAQDHRYSALYDYDAKDGQGVRAVVATVATDGSWRVDVPGGALGGSVDVSIVQTQDGVYQCTLPSAANPVTASCARVADPGKRVPKEYDPKVQRVFRQWLSVFQDRQAPLSVVAAQPLSTAAPQGVKSSCYSVDTVSASLRAPVDVGIYCYSQDGLLTAARVGFGTLTLASVAQPPPRIDLPGPVTGAPGLETKSPPPPPVTADPSLAPSGAAG
ncbi:hypothetical protein AB0M20_26005 [Actinoplanes sp. NPDC051633]|uniref:hypothetical protein n=1 Tax=Actinoplanes sp. NPDC051633 TaxID=3155670 RepID=UPI0034139E3C